RPAPTPFGRTKMSTQHIISTKMTIGLVALLLSGCGSTTRRPDDFSATCGPPLTQVAPPATVAGTIWRQAESLVPTRPGATSVDVAQNRAYFATIRDRIRSKWVYPKAAGERNIEGNLVIEFDIAKDGGLGYIALRQTSGTRVLDEATMTAVKLAQPFP